MAYTTKVVLCTTLYIRILVTCIGSNHVFIIDDNLEARKLTKNMGVIGFFRKPVDGTALLDTIKWTLKTGPMRKNHDIIIQ